MQQEEGGDRTLRTWIPRYVTNIKNQNYSPNTVWMYSKTPNFFARFKSTSLDVNLQKNAMNCTTQ